MTAQIIPVEQFDLVVFGGTGDLILRKLLPGLCYRDHYRQLAADSRIIGASCSQIDRDGYVREVKGGLRRYLPAHDLDEATLAQFLGRLGPCHARRHRARRLARARREARGMRFEEAARRDWFARLSNRFASDVDRGASS